MSSGTSIFKRASVQLRLNGIRKHRKISKQIFMTHASKLGVDFSRVCCNCQWQQLGCEHINIFTKNSSLDFIPWTPFNVKSCEFGCCKFKVPILAAVYDPHVG